MWLGKPLPCGTIASSYPPPSGPFQVPPPGTGPTLRSGQNRPTVHADPVESRCEGQRSMYAPVSSFTRCQPSFLAQRRTSVIVSPMPASHVVRQMVSPPSQQISPAVSMPRCVLIVRKCGVCRDASDAQRSSSGTLPCFDTPDTEATSVGDRASGALSRRPSIVLTYLVWVIVGRQSFPAKPVNGF